jgi:hypothetical protein
VEPGGLSGRADIRVATPADAAAIRSVQARTWLATYPNTELGITREGLRRHLEGENGEKIAERISRTRKRIEAHAAEPGAGADFVAVLSGSVLSGSVLSGSVLSGSVLSGSVLSGSVLSGSVVGFTAPFVECSAPGAGGAAEDCCCVSGDLAG